jgi:hypothetical protein
MAPQTESAVTLGLSVLGNLDLPWFSFRFVRRSPGIRSYLRFTQSPSIPTLVKIRLGFPAQGNGELRISLFDRLSIAGLCSLQFR